LDIKLTDDVVFPVADILKQRGIPFVFATGFQSNIVPQRHSDITRHVKPLDLRALAEEFVS
jgi:predicted TIM-barrel fold metal-dependent hydrolase